jgi:hypothetical protein
MRPRPIRRCDAARKESAAYLRLLKAIFEQPVKEELPCPPLFVFLLADPDPKRWN